MTRLRVPEGAPQQRRHQLVMNDARSTHGGKGVHEHSDDVADDDTGDNSGVHAQIAVPSTCLVLQLQA